MRVFDEITLNGWPDVAAAETFASRLVGMMGRKEVADGEGLWFPRCSSVHMKFMSCPLDIVAIDREGVVVGCDTVAPWQKVPRRPGAASVLEVRAGSSASLGIKPGARLLAEGPGSEAFPKGGRRHDS